MSCGKKVVVDFWDPIHTGEYLLVKVCKQYRWVEVEFVTSMCARAVTPKMDKTLTSLGNPVSVSSDSGPPFNGKDFSDFSKYLCFRHERKTLLNQSTSQCRGQTVHKNTEEAVQSKQVDGIKLQTGSIQIPSCLPSDAALRHQDCSSRSDVSQSQVSYQASNWSNSHELDFEELN